jgi:sugar phosphate isomerase/epimerase
MHLSDSDSKLHKDRPNSITDRHLAPGKGKLPLKGFLCHPRETNYKDIISIKLLLESIEAKKGK